MELWVRAGRQEGSGQLWEPEPVPWNGAGGPWQASFVQAPGVSSRKLCRSRSWRGVGSWRGVPEPGTFHGPTHVGFSTEPDECACF